MPVVIFNKRTGRYLRRHSGSYYTFRRRIIYKREVRERIQKEIGNRPNKNDPALAEWQKKASQILEKEMFGANPEDARIYATAGSALTSVGELNPVWREERPKSGECCNKNINVYVLPGYLEIHEIKEAFMCIMRPDGSSNCDEEE